VKQIRYVENDDPLDEQVTIYGRNHASLQAPVLEILDKAKALRIGGRTSLPVVSQTEPTQIEQFHRGIVATARKLRKQRPNKDGIVSAIGDGYCGIEVGSGCLEKALSLLNALAIALETHGLTITPAGNRMAVAAGGEKITFRLREYVRREKHVPTEDELAAEERRRKRLAITWDSPYGRAYPEWDFVRTSELLIEIENQYVRGMRRTWREGKRQLLVNLVSEIVAGIMAYGAALRLEAEKRAQL
jgi:hypothetical protein